MIQGRFRSPANTTRFGLYGPILVESAQFGTNRCKSKPSQCKSEEKKKKAQTRHQRAGNRVGRRTPRQAASDSSAAPSQPCQCNRGGQSLMATNTQKAITSITTINTMLNILNITSLRFIYIYIYITKFGFSTGTFNPSMFFPIVQVHKNRSK